MRIVQITPGAGESFYCENCIRDFNLVKALRKVGHDAMTVPLYLPLIRDCPEEEPARGELFFGGINVYLQQKFALFRRTPRWLDKLLDSRLLLKWAARRAGTTAARDLGEATLSMLRGEHGRQAKELDRLVEYLSAGRRPDVVCLSNALLAGLSRRIRERLGLPVVCWLEDEDGFLDALSEPPRQEAWRTLATDAAEIDAFAATSRYYAGTMRRRLSLPEDKVHVVYPGVEVDEYPPAAAPAPTVGFISRLCRAKGLDTLVEAILILKRRDGLEGIRLRASGGSTKADEPFLADIRRRVARAGCERDVEFLASFDRPARIDLLRTLSVLSAPTRQGEAFGLYAAEALGCGVPLVLPAHGSFVEIVESTGAGLLFEPNDPAALAEALAEVLLNRDAARQMSRRGREAAREIFNVERTCRDFLAVCQKVVSPTAAGG